MRKVRWSNFIEDDDETADPRLEVPTHAADGLYRRGGHVRYRWTESRDLGRVTSCLKGFAVVYRYYAAVYRRYCEEGRLNPKRLDLIKALMIDGVSLRDFAREQGVAPQAISARIEALANRAPEFYRFWRHVNARRRRTRRSDGKKGRRQR